MMIIQYDNMGQSLQLPVLPITFLNIQYINVRNSPLVNEFIFQSDSSSVADVRICIAGSKTFLIAL